MSKKRILQIITRSDWAGGQKVLYSLVYGLKQYYPEEFEVEVACGKYDGRLIPELEKIGVKVYVLENLVREISPLKDIRAFLEIKKLIKNGRYDVVHLHSSKAGFLGRIAAKTLKVPTVVYTVHGWWPIEQYKGFKRKLFIYAERFAARYCDKMVLLCQKDLQKAKIWKIGKEGQYVITPNAIIPEPPSEKGMLRKELGIPEGVKIVGNVARLDPQKNPIRFLEVAKMVLQERSDVVFVWIGGSVVDDFYGQKVQQWLSENPEINDKIYFLPFRKDAVRLMADFDVFLLTSDAEGMPLVVLEALNQGVPVVSTDVGCVEETIGKETTASTPKELALLVLKLLYTVESHAHMMSKEKNLFSYSDFINKYVGILKGGN